MKINMLHFQLINFPFVQRVTEFQVPNLAAAQTNQRAGPAQAGPVGVAGRVSPGALLVGA